MRAFCLSPSLKMTHNTHLLAKSKVLLFEALGPGIGPIASPAISFLVSREMPHLQSWLTAFLPTRQGLALAPPWRGQVGPIDLAVAGLKAGDVITCVEDHVGQAVGRAAGPSLVFRNNPLACTASQGDQGPS